MAGFQVITEDRSSEVAIEESILLRHHHEMTNIAKGSSYSAAPVIAVHSAASAKRSKTFRPHLSGCYVASEALEGFHPTQKR